MNKSSDEDHADNFVNFVNQNFCNLFDGGSMTSKGEMELYVLTPSGSFSGYFQGSEIELVQIRYVRKTQGARTWLVIWKAIDIQFRTFGFYIHV
ncbi:hypothetical protein FF1_014112 [Malus domestica]